MTFDINESFNAYMLDTFEIPYDPSNIDHMIKFAVYRAGVVALGTAIAKDKIAKDKIAEVRGTE